MTNDKELMELNQKSYMLEGVRKNLKELGIENYDPERAWKSLETATEKQYKFFLHLLYTSQYARAKALLIDLGVIIN